MPEEVRRQYRHALDEILKDPGRYNKWIKEEIETLINLVNKFDKIYILGGLGIKLLKASPTFSNQLLENYDGVDKEEVKEELIQEDDTIEVALEYVMNISTATSNLNQSIIPEQSDINEVYNQIKKIKVNLNHQEYSHDFSKDDDDFDHWLRTTMIIHTDNVRGDGYQKHIEEVYKEIFQPHNGFLTEFYGFDSNDLLNTILKLDNLVYSKVGNALGATQQHKRFVEWSEKVDKEVMSTVMMKTGKHFIRQFTEENPDLYCEESPDKITSYNLDYIEGYNKIFWVIPHSDKEKLIFEKLSIEFGDNAVFYEPAKFKARPLNDSLIKFKPLIKENNKYYHFSNSLAFRNIFKITEGLIKNADAIYFEHTYKGNSNANSRDNYIELKVKQLFQKLLPSANFYHSLNYTVTEDGVVKNTELDIIGVAKGTVYIIEVKAGELNLKHRRGAIKGLKNRLEEIINVGSYQCQRALKYVEDNEYPSFEYIEDSIKKTLTIDKTKTKSFYKISVTYEHLSSISANLKYLVDSGVLSADYKWTWIVSLYDMMVFTDLIQSENEFKEYLDYRLSLYERNDIEIVDEIDVLGFYFGGNFPLPEAKKDQLYIITGFKEEIDNYYIKSGFGLPIEKPKKREDVI
ncbi:MAG TPA: hypothetical protein VK806_06655 [Bacteroidia bacterium]|nr:hypothetical protein [Bacteroidia bacterium]